MGVSMNSPAGPSPVSCQRYGGTLAAFVDGGRMDFSLCYLNLYSQTPLLPFESSLQRISSWKVPVAQPARPVHIVLSDEEVQRHNASRGN
jgi:hypothetical protein